MTSESAPAESAAVPTATATPSPTLAPGYVLVRSPPSVEEYKVLRGQPGLTMTTPEQSEKVVAPGSSWHICYIRHEASGTAVAMGRVIGDGAWYFHVVDMSVLPDHQRRGLGAVVLAELLREIRAKAPPGAYVNLLADAPGRALYKKFGFSETAPSSIGMAMRFKD